MSIVKVKFCATKCTNTLCFDRLPNGSCDIGENPANCLQSIAFGKLCEVVNNEVLDLIKMNKLRNLIEKNNEHQ